MKCALCGAPIERVQPCPYNRLSGGPTCDDCCKKCHDSEPFPCREYDLRQGVKRMKRKSFIQAMEAFGYSPREAVKMADYALMDFGDYQEAYKFHLRDWRFLSGIVYKGHRKARRIFPKAYILKPDRKSYYPTGPKGKQKCR